MKFSLAFLVALALSGAVNVRSTPLRNTNELNEVFQEFLNLVPIEEVTEILLEYLNKDAEVQAVVTYVQTDEFKSLVRKVEGIKDVIDFYDYLQESGLDIYGLVNSLHEAIELPPLVPGGSARNFRITGGIAGLIADIKAILPLEDLKALYNEKLETSPAFAQLVERFRSPRFQQLIDALRVNDEFQKIVKFAKEHGVDVKAVKDLLTSFLGLEFPDKHSRSPRDLEDDLADFVALVPMEEVVEIVTQYLEEDAEVQGVVEYVQSDAFRDLVKKVETINDVINFYNYLQEAGLDIYGLVNALHEAIELPPLVPGGSARNFRITGGIAGLIADIKAILPLEDLKALYNEKLETSPAFAQLVERFRSPRFQQLIDALRVNDEFQKIVKFAKEHGVDVKAVKDLLTSFLGLEFPDKHSRSPRDLEDDLADFVALVPMEEVVEIVTQYLEEDAEVQGVVEYVQSDAFRDLVKKVESINDVINFYNYLQEAGLDIYGLVNALHEAIELPPLVPGGSARNFRITGGIAGLIADIKAILPLEDLKALYNEKLETSPAFAQLVERFRSPRFQQLIDALRVNDEFQKIVKFAKEHGVDVKAVKDLLTSFLGLEFPDKHSRSPRDLEDDLADFIALVPMEEVVEIVMQYLEEDAEVQGVVEYVQSDAFRDLVKKVESINDVINFYNYLQEAGLDIYGLVNALHEAIELPPLVPGGSARNFRITGGIAGLIADIKAILPLEDLKALYNEKLETSPAFAQLVERFRSPRFQQLIDALRVNDEFQKIVKFAKERGVDVKAVKDLLTSFLGLEFPDKHSRSPRDLEDDLADFVALVPMEEVVEIVTQYLEEDAEVQGVVEYVQSDAFRDLVKKVESINDVINFYNYLQEAGLDIYGLVNALHEVIGLPPLVPGGSARNFRITGGIAGLIADIKAILPLEDLKALYNEKLETSPAFAQLVEHFRSPRFQQLIDALRVNDEFQKIVKFAKEHGVDVTAVKDLLTSFLGLEFPSKYSRSTRDLDDDLADFLALVPMEEVEEIVTQYLEEDAEVQAVVKYIQSDGFRDLVKKVESIDDVINFYNYLQEAGLDIYGLVNALHEVIGLPPLVPGGSARNIRITGGVAGLIADVKAVLPLEDIKALYHKKLETSPAFAKLVERFSSSRFQQLIDALRANEEFQKILHFAKSHGVDVKAITDLLNSMFGLEFPSKRSRSTQDLQDDFLDFLALVPMEEVEEIVTQYLEEDAEVQAVVAYVQSDAFRDLVKKVESIEDVINFYNYLQESGLNIYGLVNSLHEAIGLPPLVPGRSARNIKITGGIAGFIADIKAVLPLEDIKALYHEKLETSPAFAKLVERLSSPRFQELIDTLRANNEFQKILNFANEHGVNVAAIKDLLTNILGLGFPSRHARSTRSLKADLADFGAILPFEEINKIALDYYENDPEIQQVYEYMQSDAFRQLVQEIEAIKEARDVLAYLQESGLEVYEFLNIVHELFGIPPYQPAVNSKKSMAKITGGVAGYVADIKAILPMEEIKALYYKKLETSPAFVKLIERLSSQEFQDFVDAVLAKEEARVIIGKLKAHGLDLGAVADLFATMLGLHFPKPATIVRGDLNDDNLQEIADHLSTILGFHFPIMDVRVSRALDRISEELLKDLADFIDLLPMEKIGDIAVDYVFNDPDVQAAAVYVKSPEFRKIAIPAQQNREFRRFLHYLDSTGLPASFFINKVNNYLRLPEVVPSPLKRSKRSGGGVRGMLDAIEAVLPREEIKALFEYKKQNSKAFRYMVERLEAPELQDIVDELSLNEDFRNLGIQAASYGINIDSIINFLGKAFGIEIHYWPMRSARSLHTDLQEFVALIPEKQIRRIVTKYYLFDKEFKAAVNYARSEDFAQLIRDLHEVPEYNELLKTLEEAGLDVQTYIAKLHGLIGYEGFRFSRLERTTNGMAGFVAEIKATLPIADIKALYKQKLETSEDFAGLVELISSHKFQAVTDALFANEIFQDILHRLQAHGIDLNAVSEFFLTIFGITTPPGVIDFSARL